MFEIGNSLREARERRDWAIPEIELATKIRAKYIRALEEEDFTAIPGDAYIRGFLRTYSDYLGLDRDVYVDEYASRSSRAGATSCPRGPSGHGSRPAGAPSTGASSCSRWPASRSWRPSSSQPSAFPARRRRTRRDREGEEQAAVEAGSSARPQRREARERTSRCAAARRSGKLDLQGTVAPGQIDRIPGDRFYLLVRTPAGLQITLDGRAVALPAVHNLRVLVTPQRTTRLRG